MRTFFRGTLAAVWLIGLYTPFAIAKAQTADQSAANQTNDQASVQVNEPASVLKVTTRLVIVDVVATDHKGLPVKDLKQSDFVVTEDGKQQNVRVFNFQSFQAPPAGEQPAAQLVEPALPPNVVTNVHRKSDRPLAVLLLDGI